GDGSLFDTEFQEGSVIAEGTVRDVRGGEGVLCDVEAVIKDTDGPDDDRAGGPENLDSLEGAFTGRKKIFHHHRFLAGLEMTLDLVAQTVFLWLGADVYKRQLELVGGHGAPGDAGGGDPGQEFSVFELGENDVTELALDKFPD